MFLLIFVCNALAGWQFTLITLVDKILRGHDRFISASNFSRLWLHQSLAKVSPLYSYIIYEKGLRYFLCEKHVDPGYVRFGKLLIVHSQYHRWVVANYIFLSAFPFYCQYCVFKILKQWYSWSSASFHVVNWILVQFYRSPFGRHFSWIIINVIFPFYICVWSCMLFQVSKGSLKSCWQETWEPLILSIYGEVFKDMVKVIHVSISVHFKGIVGCCFTVPPWRKCKPWTWSRSQSDNVMIFWVNIVVKFMRTIATKLARVTM